jgi:hypothetical protein
MEDEITTGAEETTQETTEQVEATEQTQTEQATTETAETAEQTDVLDLSSLSDSDRAFLRTVRERGIDLGALDAAISQHAEKASLAEIEERAAEKIEDYGQKLIAQVQEGEITEDEARALYSRELKAATLAEENAMLKARIAGSERETTVSKIATEFPYANVDLLRLAAKDGTPANELRKLADTEHKRVSKLLEGERAKYATEKRDDKDATSTVPSGSSAGGRARGGGGSEDSSSYWSSRFGN